MTNYFRYHLHIDRHQKIDGEWSVKQMHVFDTAALSDRFNRIDPTQPTMIHIVGEHLLTFSHPISDLALYLADIYGSFDNMRQNVTIILDEPNELAFEDFKYEFDHVQFNDQAYQTLENRLKKKENYMNKKQLWTNKNELDQAYKNIIKPYLTANNSAVKIVHLDEYIAATTIKRILDRIVDTEWFANVYSTSVHTMHTLFEWLLTDPTISKQLATVKNNDDNIISDIKHELKHFQKDELRNYALNNPINNLNESVTTHESNINSKHLSTKYR